MYNESYINDFKESEYIKYLEDPAKLDILKSHYLNQYTKESDAKSLAFKESLDHYIYKKLSTDANFINTKSFINYLSYITDIIQQKRIKTSTGQNFYPELTSNIVLSGKFREEIMTKYYKPEFKKKCEDQINENITVLASIYNKLVKEEEISQEELNIYADYLYSKRDFRKADIFVKYILNNAGKYNINSSPAIIGAITSYLSQEYTLDSDIKNTRFFIANKDGTSAVKVAHSSGRYKYCVLEKDCIDKTSLSSTDSISRMRTYKENDIYWLIFVCFHELTHQHQKNELERGTVSSAAISYIMRNMLDKHLPKVTYQSGKETQTLTYYRVNHDSDEIEIQADEEGWKQLRIFIKKHLNNELLYQETDGKKVSLWMTAHKNVNNVAARRTFTMKEDAITALKKNGQSQKRYYAYYDLLNLEEIMKKNPHERNNYPLLKKHLIKMVI